MPSRRRVFAAFTLLELAVAIVVVAILVILMLPVIGKLRARAQRGQCSANLRSLHTAASLYMQQHGSWPQVRLDGDSDHAWQDYAKEWIDALASFGVERKTWICPTRQQQEGNPDYTKPEYVRIDYLAMNFDDKPLTPHEWPTTMFWFAENGDFHGNGNLMVFPDGSIKDLKTYAAQQSPATK